ncbi:MAG: hypothetical protein A3F11_08100 [Gammaproteobacteria bacterium RIFCSPHIGHO2_12_FULL_37_14]|nr:MAG: hypothetical protein A3F11_08100 [Gammaproteobacteria bacterium RIFCSPHIGHO2_12_FULL_37_14]
MPAPILVQPISAQIVNEQAAYGPFDLKEYFQSDTPLKFRAEQTNEQALPRGLICTMDGILTGIPARETHGDYEFVITVENEIGSVQTKLLFTIKPSVLTSIDHFDQLKSQIWEALEKNLPLPDLKDVHDRPITVLDVYYLLERWATLKIWDAFNLDPPGELKIITLEGMSDHYQVYDRVNCLVAVPKDLFSHERTIEDGLKTARAMAREVYKRGWTIELVGFDKLVRAAWIELQYLGELHNKRLDILNFNPSEEDIKLYYTRTHGSPIPRIEL